VMNRFALGVENSVFERDVDFGFQFVALTRTSAIKWQ
jgi:hypothetical protein